MNKLISALILSSLSIVALSGCAPVQSDLTIAVTHSGKGCELSQTEFPAGVVTFAVENLGDQTAEFYVLRSDGNTILSELENIGPGTVRTLTLQLVEGNYIYSCEQMDGDKVVQGKLKALPSEGTVSVSSSEQAAINAYLEYVAEQGVLLQEGTEQFATAINNGDVAKAKDLYPTTRVYWERIEPIAESFGDLDPIMDAREGDLEPGVKWTGWHALEKQLWITGLNADAGLLADQLVDNTEDLISRIQDIRPTLAEISNGAKALLDEIATGKITGEEERYSRTDLWDFAANLEGAEKVFEVSIPILKTKDSALLETLKTEFSALWKELNKYRKGAGYVLYNELDSTQVKTLATKVEALSEPLSKMTAALVK